MRADSGLDWEDAFANAAYIPGGETFPVLWGERAARFREANAHRADLAYGGHDRERLDLFQPAGASRGLAVVVHGGYWLAFDKSSWSDLASGALAQGWTVAMPSYPLAPEATIGSITASIGRAIAIAAQQVPGPIRLAGHSAGGHLVTRMICEGAPLAPDIASRIERVVSISGLHDLRPLQFNSMNERLKLDQASAVAESPALQRPLEGIEVTAWVGGLERPEFLRQAAVLVEAWRRKGVSAQLVVDPGKHHFDVIDGLKDPAHPLARAFGGSSLQSRS
jgi:acetyl esterase/lipase